MLRLSRKEGQKIIITPNHGDEIIVSICYTGNRCVGIGIDADKSVSIDREELYFERKFKFKKSSERIRKWAYAFVNGK